ncbi:hypothetical protein VNO77_29457 [Canavalia gladiata]|uniref:Uncharacterized protein n=1 Tax=Canavalia gladiata TaxID=3824 RepID=A0AAN9KZI2_CANGL
MCCSTFYLFFKKFIFVCWDVSIVGSELELVEVGKTQIKRLHPFNEDGVEGTHGVLKEGFGGVKNLHGACRGGGGKEGESGG